MEILYVEEDSDDIELVSYAVQNIDPEVKIREASATKALEMLRTGLKPDIIFTEFFLSKQDGFDFVRSVKEDERLKNTPVVVLTTDVNNRIVQTFNELGVYRFVSKMALIRRPAEVLRNVVSELNQK
jgi:two-component system chemotaxis response regulator CheY